MSSVIGVGIDAVDIDRFQKVIERRPNILGRLFTEDERAHALAKASPGQHLAVRFAAKEAVMKAMSVGIGAFRLADVEVVRDENSGAPSILLHDQALQLSREIGVVKWLLSMTHTDSVATAIAIAQDGHP